jgi:hypothetical protein
LRERERERERDTHTEREREREREGDARGVRPWTASYCYSICLTNHYTVVNASYVCLRRCYLRLSDARIECMGGEVVSARKERVKPGGLVLFAAVSSARGACTRVQAYCFETRAVGSAI